MTITKTGLVRLIALGGIVMAFLTGVASLHAQTGPFAITNWPPTISSNATVHYCIADTKAVFSTPTSPGWKQTLSFADDGDQTYDTISTNGLTGLHSTDNFMNIADTDYTVWTNTPVIDILLQVYGDKALFNADGSGREVIIRTGALNSENPVSAGIVPAGVNNGQWNWILFNITNATNPATSKRYVGDIPDSQQPGVDNGGVNGGTLRIEGVPGIIIRAVAVGQHGAFGTTNQINIFARAAQPAKGSEKTSPSPRSNK
jgi:hypothetical protein